MTIFYGITTKETKVHEKSLTLTVDAEGETIFLNERVITIPKAISTTVFWITLAPHVYINWRELQVGSKYLPFEAYGHVNNFVKYSFADYRTVVAGILIFDNTKGYVLLSKENDFNEPTRHIVFRPNKVPYRV